MNTKPDHTKAREIAQSYRGGIAGKIVQMTPSQKEDAMLLYIHACEARDKEADEELRRWQDKIRDVVINRSGAPDYKIDGGGCDSGDPLDFTIAEIGQGFNYTDKEAETLREALRVAQKAIAYANLKLELLGFTSDGDARKPLIESLSKIAALNPHTDQ